MSEIKEYYIPYPDQKAFGEPKKATDLGVVLPYEFLRAEYPEHGGILIYKSKLLFPSRGFPFPQAIQSINVAKRLFIDSVYLLTDKKLFGLYFGLLFSTFNGKVKVLNKFLSVYCRSMIQIVKATTPLRRYLIPVASELQGITETFLKELGTENQNAEMAGEILGSIINYDNAYHFRLVDLFSLMDKEKLLKNPAKELQRSIKIFVSREIAVQVTDKFKKMLFVFTILFWSKRIKNAFLRAVDQAKWSNLCYTVIDEYNVLERGDYNFLGLTYEQRIDIFLYLHNGVHPGQINIIY